MSKEGIEKLIIAIIVSLFSVIGTAILAHSQVVRNKADKSELIQLKEDVNKRIDDIIEPIRDDTKEIKGDIKELRKDIKELLKRKDD